MNKILSDGRDERILVLAPIGRDAELAANVIARAGLCPIICSGLGTLVTEIDHGCGAILLAEESLESAVLPRLLQRLAEQPPWSDIPLVLLTSGGSATDASRRALELFGPLSNVTVLERPIRIMTLTSALQSALRARRRQLQVRELLDQREQVLASIQDAYVMVDRGWRYTYANQQACEFTGLKVEELLGRLIWHTFPGADDAEFEANLRSAMDERVTRNFEWHNESWQRWFSIRVYPSAVGLALFTVEITERKRMEAVLRESEHRLHIALASSDLGTWYCDLPFDKILFDDSCKRHFGLPMDAEIDFDRFYSLLHPDDRDPTRAAIDVAVQGCGNYDVEYRAIHADGSVHWIHA